MRHADSDRGCRTPLSLRERGEGKAKDSPLDIANGRLPDLPESALSRRAVPSVLDLQNLRQRVVEMLHQARFQLLACHAVELA